MADPTNTAAEPPIERKTRHMELSVTGGSVVLTFPDPMDAADLADLRESLAIWLRGMERRAIKEITDTE